MLLADGTAAVGGAVPVGADAVHAEVVSTRRGDGLDQDIQADGTQQLVPQKAAAVVGGHYWKREENKRRKDQFNKIWIEKSS